jgi:serine/threonine protein phosphatase PrpC
MYVYTYIHICIYIYICIKGGPDEDAAKYIVKTAIKRGSADNITAIVVYL